MSVGVCMYHYDKVSANGCLNETAQMHRLNKLSMFSLYMYT